jgi:hypothetical protein
MLVLYAFFAAGEGMRALSRPAALAQALLVLLLMSLSVPAMAFLYQRTQAPGRQTAITDWYRAPDIGRARSRAQTHLDLLDDMRTIRELTKPEDRVMWFVPSYVALLADRRGVAAPDARTAPEGYREAVRKSGADYVFLSRYHPRDTITDRAWQAGVAALGTNARIVHTSALDGGSVVTSLLLKADR